eukprot:6200145-Pleurochrysis_carterae.AAC.4
MSTNTATPAFAAGSPRRFFTHGSVISALLGAAWRLPNHNFVKRVCRKQPARRNARARPRNRSRSQAERETKEQFERPLWLRFTDEVETLLLKHLHRALNRSRRRTLRVGAQRKGQVLRTRIGKTIRKALHGILCRNTG